MNHIINNLPNILGFIAITLFLFILIRELICWYFKINERVQLQKDILAELVKFNKKPVYDLEYNGTFKDVYPLPGGQPSGKGGVGMDANDYGDRL